MRKGSPERGDMRVRGKAFPFEGKVARRAGADGKEGELI